MNEKYFWICLIRIINLNKINNFCQRFIASASAPGLVLLFQFLLLLMPFLNFLFCFSLCNLLTISTENVKGERYGFSCVFLLFFPPTQLRDIENTRNRKNGESPCWVGWSYLWCQVPQWIYGHKSHGIHCIWMK